MHECEVHLILILRYLYFEIEIFIHQIGSKTDQETKQTVDGNPI